MRRLLLAEKFSAALRLASILSEGTAKKVRADGVGHFRFSSGADEVFVFPLRGHIVEFDYPDRHGDWEGADLDGLIGLEPVRREVPAEVHAALRRLASDVDEVVVATDYDREGELIGVEALETVRSVRPDLPARRARFSAMTPQEVRGAFAALTEPDWALAEAAATRERIDLAWGAVLTRYLTVACGLPGAVLSVGRVQTPALALVRAREREREDFVPRPFFAVQATVGDSALKASADGGPWWDREGAEAVVALARLGGEAAVERVDRREDVEPPPSPLNTTRFLADASRRGIGAPRAMAHAQDLYVRGKISYPRTDNTVYPASLPIRGLLEKLRDTPYREHVESLLSLAEIDPSRGPIRTTDHPPIHPTEARSRIGRGPVDIVYDLIARRFLATLSPSARIEVTRVYLRIGDARFHAEGRVILEPGWRGILPGTEELPLPPVSEGDVLSVHDVAVQEGRTPSPPLHSQGSLIQAMDREGLGTKSTRHEIVGLLFRRQYVEGRALRTTDAGRALVDALGLHAPDLVSADMTRRLEAMMSAIADGVASASDVVRESREDLRRVLVELRSHEASLAHWLRDAAALQRDHGPCDACGVGRLVRRRTRNGWAFLGCTEFPRCRRRLRIGPRGERMPWGGRPEASTASP